jgi:hypothetical protein
MGRAPILRLIARAALIATLVGFAAAARAAPADPATAPLVEQGRRMYMEGILPSGRPLVAVRAGGVTLTGVQAACNACHRKSGLGAVEGEIQVPPISGLALHAGTRLKDRVIVSLDPRRGRAWNQTHPPYDDASLLRAMVEGIHVTGRKMSPLMPVYPLTAEELKPLSAYLNQLSSEWSPGVTESTIRLATVIAPGIEPARVKIFRDTLQAALEQKNSNTLPGHRHMINAAEMLMGIERRWILDVWELQGAPDTWREQLEAFYAKAPVFALVSGLSDTTWDPVQAFCERESMPCWFPSIAVTPERADQQYYSLYYSRGVLVEATAAAAWMSEGRRKPHRLVQVLRDEPAARAAAAEFRAKFAPATRVEDVVLSGDAATGLRTALAGLDRQDAAMLWLGPADFAALADVEPPTATVVASTRMTRALQPQVPAKWLATLRLAYPYDLAPMRDLNMATFRSWLKVRSLPVIDEPMQLEVYFSMAYIQYTLSEMLDNMYRDYLIDRGESMLVRREVQRAEEETMIRQGGHPPARTVRESSTLTPGAIYGEDPHGLLAQKNTPAIGLRQGTTMYPRLSLAQGQRFASKGARIVHVDAKGVLASDSDWIVR